ncbi:hypothetical protein ABFU38_08290 [Xanthomonas campestris pv. raphani]
MSDDTKGVTMDGLVVGLPSQFVMAFSAVVQRSARRVAMFRLVKKLAFVA